MSRLPIVAPRTCGDCTACCTTMAVDEIAKPRDTACAHATPRGCGVYDERPASCRHFRCAWLARDSALLTTAMRPDRSGVVLWQEQAGRAGVVLVAQETRPGAASAPKMATLLRELAHHRPLVVRSPLGETRVAGPGVPLRVGEAGS